MKKRSMPRVRLTNEGEYMVRAALFVLILSLIPTGHIVYILWTGNQLELFMDRLFQAGALFGLACLISSLAHITNILEIISVNRDNR